MLERGFRSYGWAVVTGRIAIAVALGALVVPESAEAEAYCSIRSSVGLDWTLEPAFNGSAGEESACSTSPHETTVNRTVAEYWVDNGLYTSESGLESSRRIVAGRSEISASASGIRAYATVAARPLIDPIPTDDIIANQIGAGEILASGASNFRTADIYVSAQGVDLGTPVTITPTPEFSFRFSPLDLGANAGCAGDCGSPFYEWEITDTTLNVHASLGVVAYHNGSIAMNQRYFWSNSGTWLPANDPSLLWDISTTGFSTEFYDQQLGGAQLFLPADGENEIDGSPEFGSFVVPTGESYSVLYTTSWYLQLTTPKELVYQGYEECYGPNDEFCEPVLEEEFVGYNYPGNVVTTLGGAGLFDSTNTLEFGGFEILDGPDGVDLTSADGTVVGGQFVGALPAALSIVPEPGTGLMLGAGLLALARRRRH